LSYLIQILDSTAKYDGNKEHSSSEATSNWSGRDQLSEIHWLIRSSKFGHVIVLSLNKNLKEMVMVSHGAPMTLWRSGVCLFVFLLRE